MMIVENYEGFFRYEMEYDVYKYITSDDFKKS